MQTWGKPIKLATKQGSDQETQSVQKTQNNRLYFYSDVTTANILKLNTELRTRADTLLCASIAEERTIAPLFLHIQSYGGGIFCGLSGMDSILMTCKKVPVYTVVDGCCASAATFLSMVGTRRLITENSFILIHQISNGMWGKYEEFKDEMANMDVIMELMTRLYQKYTKMPKRVLKEILKHDLWLPAETCLTYGLVDEVIRFK